MIFAGLVFEPSKLEVPHPRSADCRLGKAGQGREDGSMDWFKGKFTGKPSNFNDKIWDFLGNCMNHRPIDIFGPENRFISRRKRTSWHFLNPKIVSKIRIKPQFFAVHGANKSRIDNAHIPADSFARFDKCLSEHVGTCLTQLQ